MKFLGIDTKIIGDNTSVKGILELLHDIEENFKLYIHPAYLDKFFFVANIYGQNLYCDIVDSKNEEGTMSCDTYFAIYNLNETQNSKYLLEQLNNNYSEILQENEYVYTCLNAIKDYDKENEIEEETDPSKINNAIFTFKTYNEGVNEEDDMYVKGITKITDDSEEDTDYSSDEAAGDGSDEAAGDGSDEVAAYGSDAVVADGSDEVEKENINDKSKIDETQSENISNKTVSKIINCSVKTKKYIKLTLFKREAHYDDTTKTVIYDKESLIFVNSYFFNRSERFLEDYHNIHNASFDDKNNILENLDDIFKTRTLIFKDCHELNEIYMKKVPYTFDLISILMTNQSGAYFNPNDLTFSILLNRDIGETISNENLIEDFSYKYFYKVNYRDTYKYNFDKNSIVDRINFGIESCVTCDICESKISVKTRSYFYSNPNVGDICRSCYEKKKKLFFKRINHIKKKMILIGKIALFNKEKQKIIDFLKTAKIPELSKEKRQEIHNRAFNIATRNYNPPTCKICFGEIHLEEPSNNSLIPHQEMEINMGNTNISVSSCGHIFHTQCIADLVNYDKCPYCRQTSNFTRIFL